MGRKLPTTPRSRIKNALRQMWLRSRERAACLKAATNHCERCGRKQSKAKDRDPSLTVDKLQVHHKDGINWDGVVDLVIERLLHHPSRLESVCKECHDTEHNQQQAKDPF